MMDKILEVFEVQNEINESQAQFNDVMIKQYEGLLEVAKNMAEEIQRLTLLLEEKNGKDN